MRVKNRHIRFFTAGLLQRHVTKSQLLTSVFVTVFLMGVLTLDSRCLYGFTQSVRLYSATSCHYVKEHGKGTKYFNINTKKEAIPPPPKGRGLLAELR